MKKLENFTEAKIISFSRICDLIKIDFKLGENELCLHVQKALFRVLEFNELLISSYDINIPSNNYKKKLFRTFKPDIPGNTLFDDELKKHENKIINSTVIENLINGKDLFIKLNNNLKIEIIVDTTIPECEVYRFFEKDNLDSHIVIES